jgi:hypothetical protein
MHIHACEDASLFEKITTTLKGIYKLVWWQLWQLVEDNIQFNLGVRALYSFQIRHFLE